MEKDIRADLRIARARSGLSNVDVAHLLGCGKDRISKLENGSARASLEEVAALQLIYGAPFERTFGILCRDLTTPLNRRLETMPREPAHWAGKRASRLATLDRLSQRLVALNQTQYAG